MQVLLFQRTMYLWTRPEDPQQRGEKDIPVEEPARQYCDTDHDMAPREELYEELPDLKQ